MVVALAEDDPRNWYSGPIEIIDDDSGLSVVRGKIVDVKKIFPTASLPRHRTLHEVESAPGSMEMRLSNVKRPVPLPGPLTPPRHVAENEDGTLQVITALLRIMGGQVTLTPSDLYGLDNERVIVMRQRDPELTILRIDRDPS